MLLCFRNTPYGIRSGESDSSFRVNGIARLGDVTRFDPGEI